MTFHTFKQPLMFHFEGALASPNDLHDECILRQFVKLSCHSASMSRETIEDSDVLELDVAGTVKNPAFEVFCA